MSKNLSWCKNLKDKENPNDKKMTPLDLAQKLIQLVPLEYDDNVLEGFRGTGAFYHNFPPSVNKDWCEIEEDRDFFNYHKEYDWLISNPPYSKIQKILNKSLKEAKKGIALLVGIINLTPKRLKLIEDNGFKITNMHICNVSGWFSNSVFIILQKGDYESIISYTSKPYNMPLNEMKEYKLKCKYYQQKYYNKKFKGKYKEWKEKYLKNETLP